MAWPGPRVPRAKRSLSQCFLVDRNVQKKVVDALEAKPGDSVLEIGPGHGELSAHLVGTVRHLCVVEKDERLAEALAERWKGCPEVRVVAADALKLDLDRYVRDLSPYRVLSNLPYNVTSPLLFALLSLRPAPERILVTVQREVAQRLVARPGTSSYGALSVGVQVRADPAVVMTIGRGCFRPVPKVDSAVLRIDPAPARAAELSSARLRRLTRVAFGRRRKQLQKILRTAPEYRLSAARIDALCEELDLDPRMRPQDLTPRQYVELAARLPPAGDVPSCPRAGDEAS
ncbi:MAG: 16S rRNA (adenine(1518)-N(6)/adenine(1519)-N(6))-dimethyltransferase RsmA [Gemmatimonadota bacterium]